MLAVTGATGIVGRFVCQYFLSRGHRVRGLHRPSSNLAGFEPAMEWVEGEGLEDRALQQLLQRDGEPPEALVHCAFSHVPGKYRGGEGDNLQAFWQENLGGTLRTLQHAENAGVQRVVLMSSRAVFGRRRQGEDSFSPIADDHPTWPTTHYGALKVAEEALAGAFVSMDVCALRPTGVYGVGFPVTVSKWYTMIEDLLKGVLPTVNRTSTEVHGSDVAKAIECLLQAPAEQVRQRGFNCSDIQITTAQLVQKVATKCDLHLSPMPEAEPQANPMRCDALLDLGWQPGGERLLDKTLDQLVTQVRTSA